MLTIGHIAKLIADKACIANGRLLVSVRVSENPRIYTAVSSPVVPISQNQLHLQSFNLSLQSVKEFRGVSTIHLGMVELERYT